MAVARTLSQPSVYGLCDLRPTAKAQPAVARQLPRRFELVLRLPATSDSKQVSTAMVDRRDRGSPARIGSALSHRLVEDVSPHWYWPGCPQPFCTGWAQPGSAPS